MTMEVCLINGDGKTDGNDNLIIIWIHLEEIN